MNKKFIFLIAVTMLATSFAAMTHISGTGHFVYSLMLFMSGMLFGKILSI